MSEYIVNFGDKTSSAFVGLAMAEVQNHGAKLHEEIVRCRDCKHFTPRGTHKFENGKVNEDYCDYVRGWMLQITPDGFCAWGERAWVTCKCGEELEAFGRVRTCPSCGRRLMA